MMLGVMTPATARELVLSAPSGEAGEVAARILYTLELLGYDPADTDDALVIVGVTCGMLVGMADQLDQQQVFEPMQRVAVEKLCAEVLSGVKALLEREGSNVG